MEWQCAHTRRAKLRRVRTHLLEQPGACGARLGVEPAAVREAVPQRQRAGGLRQPCLRRRWADHLRTGATQNGVLLMQLTDSRDERSL